ncbi:MAG: radical SAM protein [Candidatus Bathyarchaeia archaeon]
MQSPKALKVHFISNACEEGLLDTQRLKLLSKDAGFKCTNNVRQADFILFYACGHLDMHDVESAQIIERINRLKKPSARLIVWGCLPKINPGAIQAIYDGPLLGPEEWDFFADLFNQPRERTNLVFANALYPQVNSQVTFSSPHRIIDFTVDKLYSYTHKKWYIKIVSGCRNCCTYCSDRLAYRWSRDVPIETILRQFELGLAANYMHFEFVGRDLGCYGHDIGLTLADLLNKIAETYPDNKYKISINNVSPNSLIALYPKLDKKLLSKRIFEIGSHIQSGSERILKQMGKTFNLDDWEKTIQDIDKNYPSIRILTSIMLGFPGETEDDFKKTMNLLSHSYFDRINWYIYCERPNLPSLKLKDRVPEVTKMRRMKEAKNLAKDYTRRKRIKRIRMRYLRT